MTPFTKALITAAYGVWLAAAGIMRGTKAAVGFGATTGVMAVVAAILLAKGKRTAANVLIVVTLLFVVGFFISKSYREGLDTRVAITLITSVIEAVVFFMPAPATADAPSVSAK